MYRKSLELKRAGLSHSIDYWLINVLLLLSYLPFLAMFYHSGNGLRWTDITQYIFLQGIVLLFTGIWQGISSGIHWFWAPDAYRPIFKTYTLVSIGLFVLFATGVWWCSSSFMQPFKKEWMHFAGPLLYFGTVNILSWHYQGLLKRYYGL